VKRLSLLFITALVVASTALAGAQEAKIRLVVEPAVIFAKLVEAPKDNARYMTAGAGLYIENCGTTSVTIPTRIAPCEIESMGPQGESRVICYAFFYEKRHGKNIQPAPDAYGPVTLQPGEQTQIGNWQPQKMFRDALPAYLNNVTFVFQVADDLAARFRWWSGKLEVRCDFSQQLIAPNQSPQPTPPKGG
jgi:hypothetical protein